MTKNDREHAGDNRCILYIKLRGLCFKRSFINAKFTDFIHIRTASARIWNSVIYELLTIQTQHSVISALAMSIIYEHALKCIN